MSVSYTILENTNLDLEPNGIVNGYSDGTWVIGSTITHSNNRGSYASKSFPFLTTGQSYRVTYTIVSYTTCEVKIYLGDTVGTTRTSNGTFTETLTYTGTNRKLRFYATGNASISYYKIEAMKTTIDEIPLDPSTMENNSWTLSYNPLLNQWISFHSYIPNNYLSHPNKLLTKRNDSSLMLVNSGDYGVFFDNQIKPFIIETIFNEAKVNTKVFDSISVVMDTYNGDIPTNTFFDNGIMYTENQCTGTITFNIGTNVTRKERNWNFNKLQDITNNLTENIFVSDWDSVSSSYPIDKVININKIDTSKPWFERGRLRDKYLAVRFIENNLDNTKFICKFVINSFRASQR
jgi:hypothetical protein